MKVAITNPTTWPYVRRGAERFINELASYLSTQGHNVTVISGKPGRTEVAAIDGYVSVCHRRLWHPVLAKIGLLEFHMFFFPCLAHLIRERFDVVVCLTFMDAFAARVAGRFTGTPYVFVANGIPPKKQYFRSLSTKGKVFGGAVQGAAAVVAISEYVRHYLENRWSKPCVKLPIPLDVEKFRAEQRLKAAHPTILCAAALYDRRKGGRLLMTAFDRLKLRRPDLQLQIASLLPAATQSELLNLVRSEFRPAVRFIAADDDLPELFAAATVSVLPSLWEPYGMVILESMAAGTPVVGTRDGAIPEVIAQADLGRLFDPGADATVEPTNIDALVQALDEGLELGRTPGTAQRCRNHALGFSWRRLGPEYEDLLNKVIGKKADITEEVGSLCG